MLPAPSPRKAPLALIRGDGRAASTLGDRKFVNGFAQHEKTVTLPPQAGSSCKVSRYGGAAVNNGETGIAAIDGSAPVFAPPDGQTAGDNSLLAPVPPVPLAP